MTSDDRDFSEKFNTALTPEQDQQFQDWASKQSKSVGRDVNGDLYDYDLKGWWQQNNGANLSGGHLTDEFKKPNHPTFSTGSKYHGTSGNEGGEWQKRPDGTWTFAPGKTNLQNFSSDELQGYFNKVEPGNQLLLPAQ